VAVIKNKISIMKKIVNPTIYFLLLSAFVSCEKTKGFNSVTDNPADVPITVANVYDYLPSPTVKASKAENKITITLQVPAERKITEIKKIAASTTANYTAIYNGTTVGTSTSQLWSATPIPVNAATYTFTTSFDEYKTKTATSTPASNALLGRDFYFMLTLDNGQTAISMNIRVWVVD
jgi:hypothetical protein